MPPSSSVSASNMMSRKEDAEASGADAPVKRVLIVAPSLDLLGGQAVQAARLLERLSTEQALHVDLLPVNPRLPGLLRQLQFIKYVRTLVTFPYYILLLFLRVRRYDVIHIFSTSYLSFLLAPTPALLVARLYNRKAILNYHSGEASDHLARWPLAVRTIGLADEVVVPSGYLVDVFREFDIEAQMVANFVEAESFKFRARKSLRPIFLSNRNLEPLYNVGCTIDAFAIIQREFPEAELVVAGDGSERVPIENKVRELNLANVTFLGRVSPSDMPKVYDGADVYLNSPNIDNMPLSVIEAFACGLPVVTSDAGGIPYIVEHDRTGLIFPSRNAEAMALQALRLLRDPMLAETLVSNAYRECESYRWDSVRNRWLSVYQG